ncbi:uncharacterized [Tachysurus ichikawai]
MDGCLCSTPFSRRSFYLVEVMEKSGGNGRNGVDLLKCRSPHHTWRACRISPVISRLYSPFVEACQDDAWWGFHLPSLVTGALVLFSPLIAFQQAGQWLDLHSTSVGVFQKLDADICLCRNLQSLRRTSKVSLRLVLLGSDLATA